MTDSVHSANAETKSVQARRQWTVHPLSDADGAYVVPVDHARRSIGCSTNKQADRDDYALQICALRADPHKRRNVVEDAALIAAAPELLEALQSVVIWADDNGRNFKFLAASDSGVITRIHAAIAKATGATS